MDNDINIVFYFFGLGMMGSVLRDVKMYIFDVYFWLNVFKVLIFVLMGVFVDEIERYINELKMFCVLLFVLGFIFNYSF